MKTYEAIAGALAEAGVERLFGILGEANMRVVAAYADSHPGSYVTATHESAVIGMADGYSRFSGRIGVATVTHGPGLTNALTALTEAVRARSALVVLTGSTPTARPSAQWLDVRAAANLAGACYMRADGIEAALPTLAAALRKAGITRNPVVLDIPADIMDRDLPEGTSPFVLASLSPLRPAPGDDEFDTAMGVIAASRRPVVLVGQGAVFSGARDDIIRLAEVLQAPAATTVMALGYIESYPLNLGIFGSESHSLAIETIGRSDCIIVLGASLTHHTTANGDLTRNAAIVHVDLDPLVGARPNVVAPVISDVREFARRAVEALREVGWNAGRERPANLRRRLEEFDPLSEFKDASTDDAIDLRLAMSHLDRLLPEDRIVVTDVGRFKTSPWRYLRSRPAGFTQTGSFGAIGLGLSTALGACLAHPSKCVVAVVGDGGLMMSFGELASVAERRPPLVIAVANDGSYGAEWHKLASYGHDPRHSLRRWPELTSVARSMGIDGAVVRTVDDLSRLGPRLKAVTEPFLLDIRIDPSVDTRKYF